MTRARAIEYLAAREVDTHATLTTWNTARLISAAEWLARELRRVQAARCVY